MPSKANFNFLPQAQIATFTRKNLNIDLPLVISDHKQIKNTWRLSLKEFCEAQNIPFTYNTNINTPKCIEKIKSLRPDLILSLQPHSIIKKDLISIPKYGVINLHNAPLPLLRGCDPFSWAIHDGLLYMGVTLHRILDAGIDNGPIIEQKFWEITEKCTAWDLYQKSISQGKALLKESIPKVLNKNTNEIKQNERYVTYHSKGQFDFNNLEVNWDTPCNTLSSFIRSRIFPPLQLPYFSYQGQNIYILKCNTLKLRKSLPGVVMEIQKEHISIGAKYGAIQIHQLKVQDEIVPIESAVRRLNLKINKAIAG